MQKYITCRKRPRLPVTHEAKRRRRTWRKQTTICRIFNLSRCKSHIHTPSFLSQSPNVIIEEICGYLTVAEHLKLGRTCKKQLHYTSSSAAWKTVCAPIQILDLNKLSNINFAMVHVLRTTLYEPEHSRILSRFSGLHRISLHIPKMNNLTFLKPCVYIRTLILRECYSLTCIDTISSFPDLRHLHLRHTNFLRLFDPISKCRNLISLNLSSVDYFPLSVLDPYYNLEYLRMYECTDIENIDTTHFPCEYYNNIQWVHLSYCAFANRKQQMIRSSENMSTLYIYCMSSFTRTEYNSGTGSIRSIILNCVGNVNLHGIKFISNLKEMIIWQCSGTRHDPSRRINLEHFDGCNSLTYLAIVSANGYNADCIDTLPGLERLSIENCSLYRGHPNMSNEWTNFKFPTWDWKLNINICRHKVR